MDKFHYETKKDFLGYVTSDGRIRVTNELEGTHKKAVAVQFKALFQNSPEERNFKYTATV